MFDEDHRRLVQVASIANAVAAAENASPWRALLWLAEQVEAGNLAPRLFTTVTMNTVDAAPSSPEHSLRTWRKMALRTQAEREKNMLHYHLPATASTWHVHARDLMQFAMVAEMPEAVRAELIELARQHGVPSLAQSAVPQVEPSPALRPVPRQLAQEEAILAALRASGHDPRRLPPLPPAGGACPAKMTALEMCAGMPKEVFRKAWKRLNASRLIARQGAA